MKNEISMLAARLQLKRHQVESAVTLLDAGNTVPFIARYRKEAIGGLSDEQVQHIADDLLKVRALNERRATIKRQIEQQGKLSDQLNQLLDRAKTQSELEDLYAPFKPKRETRAMRARKAGLMPLAAMILKQPVSDQSLSDIAFDYIKQPDTPTTAHVWQGARDIVAEYMADNLRTRQAFRRRAWQSGRLVVQKIEDADDPQSIYRLYYEFDQPLSALRPHQTLAINRGERAKILRVKLEISEHDRLIAIRTVARPRGNSPLHEQLELAMIDAMKRLILPAVERDVRRQLTEKAEAHAIDVFAKNVGALLTQPPVNGHTVLAIDPGLRTGCKLAAIDATGQVLDTGTIYPHAPQNQRDDALKRLANAVRRYKITLIAIGNGTASRETEKLVAELTRSISELHYLIVNEAGASVYSASELARQELPELDVTLRGAVSIGRRVQDPLAELVKIDPKSIGVGLYQHDVNQRQLAATLDNVVTLVVNRVGVDLNTASTALLRYVAGIGPTLAERIVDYRNDNGPFRDRKQLLKVSGFGPKTFEQASGFLRIYGGDNVLDATAIHPESYTAAQAVLDRASVSLATDEDERRARLQTLGSRSMLAEEFGVGLPTLEDIIEQILQPGRDPRSDLDPPLLRSDVLSFDDLETGLVLHGTVRNVVDFGAFIDIGVKQDGLLHRSRIPNGVELTIGQVLPVAIRQIEKKRERISLDWVVEHD